MKFISLPIQFEDKVYKFNQYLGLLLEYEKQKQNGAIMQPEKIILALTYCNNPYDLINKEFISVGNKSTFQQKLLIVYLEFLIKMFKLNFFIGKWISVFVKPSFKDASQAIRFFRENKQGKIQNDLCLARSLFAARTSKKFKESGVMFIGVSLPSKSMHAWIIEDGIQPDPLDNMWINFQPDAAIC